MTAKAKAARISKARAKQKARKATTGTPKQSWAERARASTFVFWLEVGAICATLLGLAFAGWGLWEQVRANRDDALARNWALLTTPASGNSGKVQALEYLASKGMVLDGIDLSCKTMGGTDKNETGEDTCTRPPYLSRLNLSETKHGKPISLHRANLSGADLWFANLSGASLSDANLSGANLSLADFKNAKLIDTVEFTGAWAWGDEKPTGLPVKIDLCVPPDEPFQKVLLGSVDNHLDAMRVAAKFQEAV